MIREGSRGPSWDRWAREGGLRDLRGKVSHDSYSFPKHFIAQKSDDGQTKTSSSRIASPLTHPQQWRPSFSAAPNPPKSTYNNVSKMMKTVFALLALFASASAFVPSQTGGFMN